MAIVGRDDLVARLRAVLDAAAAGEGRLVLLSGEAGAGKTAVVREVLAGRAARWGFCEPLDTPRPLGPFRDIIPLRQADPVAVGEGMLAELRGGGPVLVVEDAHWIDAASADVLRFLGRRIGPAGGAVLVTFRDELGADHPLRPVLGDLATAAAVLRAGVPPLDAAAVAALVTGIDPAEALRLTGGNAFLVSQLAAEPGGVATTVRDSVVARLHRLPAAARALVELLAVVPGRSGPAVLGGDWADLDPAVVAGLVRVDGDAVEFRHELVRRAVERELAPGRRRERHAEVLRRLTAGGDAEPAEVAYHARAAHDRPRALAAERTAAERASALGSHREAAAHYRRAVTDAGTPPSGGMPAAEVARLWLALSREEFWTGRDAVALADARRAAELCPPGSDPALRSTVLCWLSRLTPEQDQAHRLAAEAVAEAEPLGPSPELMTAYAHRAFERMIARDLPTSLDWAGRALALAAAVDDPASLAVALQALGSARLLAGDEGGAGPLRRGIEVGQAAGLDHDVGRAYANLVSAAGEGKLYALADGAVGEAMGYFVSRDLDAHAGYTRAWHARCLFERGRWDEAAVEAGRALAGGGMMITELTARYVLGRIAARRGEDPVDLHRAGRIAAVTGSLQRIGPVAAALAEVAWLAGDAAPPDLAAAYDLAVERANPWAIGELGLWRRRHGALDALPDLAAEPYRLQVGGDPLAAGRAWVRIGCPYEAADAFADSGDEEAVRSALATFTRLGAAPGRQRAARRLRELGVRTIPRGPQPATARDPDGLTAREQEVLGWLRDGRTDAEIAAGLHLSVRTVGHHVSAVLRKTGARSRRDLRDRDGQSAGRDG